MAVLFGKVKPETSRKAGELPLEVATLLVVIRTMVIVGVGLNEINLFGQLDSPEAACRR